MELGVITDSDDDNEAVIVNVPVAASFAEDIVWKVRVKMNQPTPLPIAMTKHLPELPDLTPEETQRLQVFYERTDVNTVILKRINIFQQIGTSLMFFQPRH
jgi:glucose-6-phosphate isomerase